MARIPPIVAVPTHLTEEAIAVNLSGSRSHDEADPYYDRAYALRKQPQETGHYIFDSVTYAAKTQYVDPMPGPLTQAPTVAPLAQKLVLTAAAVESSVRARNNSLASGTPSDPAICRVQFAPARRPIIQRPFYGKPKVEGVVDVWRKTIPGLFAVCDCAGGLTPTTEMGSTHLSCKFVLGWEAGQAAAAGEYTEPHAEVTYGQVVLKTQGVDLNLPIISVDAAQQKARL